IFSMKRVTGTKAYEDLDGLKALAAFLNFDWENGDPKDLEKLEKEARVIFLPIIHDALKNRDKAKAVQAELKTDLVPIFAPEERVTPEEADRRLRKLIRKLNEVESKTEWDIDPIDYEWTSCVDAEGNDLDDIVLAPLDPEEVESEDLLIHPSAELNLLGYRWRFGRRFKYKNFSFSQEALQVVLEAFESGAIARFRT